VRLPMRPRRGDRVVAEQWRLPRAAARARLDLLHTIAYGPPWLYRGVKVLTVHDLALWVMPETVPARWRRYWQWAYAVAGRDCRMLIAVSECTKHDAVNFLKRSPDEVRVVACGVDPIYSPSPPGHDAGAVVRSLGLPDSFVLNVGTVQPRKDMTTLLAAFARLRSRHADLHLVIAGGRGWGYDDLDDRIANAGLSGAVHLTGFIDRAVLPDLYRASKLFLFSTRYEGFGLPLLEAMASGTPVVTTTHSAIPEVVGDAALVTPPGDADALAEAAGRVLEDEGLRLDLVRRGLERASRFEWRESARGVLAVYREVLNT